MIYAIPVNFLNECLDLRNIFLIYIFSEIFKIPVKPQGNLNIVGRESPKRFFKLREKNKARI